MEKLEYWMRPNENLKKDLYDLLEKLGNNISMVEIGCYSGESSEIFCSSLKIIEFNAVDPWENGYDDNDEASFKRPMNVVEAAFDKRMSKFNNKVKKYKLQSNKAASFFNDRSLDFVYIDGLHTYDGVKNDISLWFNKIKKNGFIGGHDFHMSEVKKAVIEKLNNIDYRFCGGSWLKKII